MRFRTSGKNWEGRTWALSAALEQLGEQVSAAWPTPHPSDGTVASKTHDATSPSSDHRPRPFTGSGMVRALDVGEYGSQGDQLFDELRDSRDPRIKYVIHGGSMFSSYPARGYAAWAIRPYDLGGHGSHVHVSSVDAADDAGYAWSIALTVPAPQPTPGGFTMQITRSTIRLGDKDPSSYGGPVATAQALLVSKGYWSGAKLTRASVITGIFDATTDLLVRAYQDRHGLEVDGIIGPITWGSLESTG